MPFYYLDPRQAGTDATPDVEVWASQGQNGIDYFWKRLNSQGEGLNLGMRSAAEALRAARKAAGFGHVAERPCDCHRRTGCCTVCGQYTDFQSHLPCKASMQDPRQECSRCTWPRDAHGKEA